MLNPTCNGVQALPNLVSQILHHIPIKKIGFRILSCSGRLISVGYYQANEK
ncbi:hypothetical protein Scep_019837 [Stephania cephalantha]|uniref:Uncharacterized protein n=1 Tax=Stephania cephalantha TaxID=152367 RepID=A0AAP0IBN0_9MAGN